MCQSFCSDKDSIAEVRSCGTFWSFPAIACDTSPHGVKAVVSHIIPSCDKKPIVFVTSHFKLFLFIYLFLQFICHCDQCFVAVCSGMWHKVLVIWVSWKCWQPTDWQPMTSNWCPGLDGQVQNTLKSWSSWMKVTNMPQLAHPNL